MEIVYARKGLLSSSRSRTCFWSGLDVERRKDAGTTRSTAGKWRHSGVHLSSIVIYRAISPTRILHLLMFYGREKPRSVRIVAVSKSNAFESGSLSVSARSDTRWRKAASSVVDLWTMHGESLDSGPSCVTTSGRLLLLQNLSFPLSLRWKLWGW